MIDDLFWLEGITFVRLTVLYRIDFDQGHHDGWGAVTQDGENNPKKARSNNLFVIVVT